MNKLSSMANEKINELLKLPLVEQVKHLNIEDIKEYYEVVDFLIQTRIIEDIQKDIKYIYYTMHCGPMTNKELGLQYAENYFDITIENILEEEADDTDEDLMEYVNYEKVLEDIEKNGDYSWDYETYVDVESLGKALVRDAGFILTYFRLGTNVFEFEKSCGDTTLEHYLSEEAVSHTYLTVNKYLEEDTNSVVEACELAKNEFMNGSLEVV